MNKELTQEDLNKLFTGERPEGMDFNEYKKYRSIMNKSLRNRLKGSWHFISSTPEETNEKVREEPTRRITKTYIKPKEDENNN